MRRLPALFLAAVLTLVAGASVARAIVGGTDVPAGKYPFVARIEFQPGFQCTGTLIAPTWVMTAGHCSSLTGAGAPSPIPMTPQAYTVYLGGVKTDGSDSKTYSVKSVHVPPGYSAQNGDSTDVGLLELTEPAKSITPLHIAAVDERSSWAADAIVTAAGFGVTKSDGDQPKVMNEVDLPVVADADCAKAYPGGAPATATKFDAKTDVCAGFPEGGKDTCQGDSGGPLMSHVGMGLRLIGATSRGDGCAEPNTPGIYARVAEGDLKKFVAGLVPAAYEAEGTPDSPSSATTPTPTPTPTSTAPGASSCTGRAGLTLRFGKGVRNVRVRVAGKSILKRRNNHSAFTFALGGRLPAAGTARVRVFTRTAKGARRVTVRTYRDCQQTGIRSRLKR